MEVLLSAKKKSMLLSYFWTTYDPIFREEIWHIRMREIQGAICVASIFQLLIGYTGLIGLMLK